MPKPTRHDAARPVCSLALAAALLSPTGAFALDTAPPQRLTLPRAQGEPAERCVATQAAADGVSILLEQTFADPFDTLELQGSERWTPHYDGGFDAPSGRWPGADWLSKRTLQGNQEQQIYVDPAYRGKGPAPLYLNPFRLHDGVLSIVAERTPAPLRELLHGFEYTSGLLTSRASLVQRYGYFEIRARIPAGKALWPAFWLLPADKSWPPELDILEVVGQQAELIVSTAHWVGADGKRASSGCRTRKPEAPTGFHHYGALWTPESITYYFDREPVAHLTTPPGMDKPMFMLMNLAVGGNMVGKADADTPLPARFEIDFVAAYALPGQASCQPRRAAQEVNACSPR
jgi:beta-glucanase (GH16 family)